MKAIRVHAFGNPSVLKLEDIPEPKPAAKQVLVDVKAVGVNPVDTYIRKGTYGPREFPYTPGFDAAGVVEAVGEGATRNFKPGDRVYLTRAISGAYAQKLVAAEDTVHPLPENVSFAQGAAIGV